MMSNTTWNDSRFGPGSYEHASQEDRSAPRVPVHIPGTMRPAGGRAFATIVRDLSLGGFTATAPVRLEERNFCWLTIPGIEAIQAEVVWWDAGMVGAAFATLITQNLFDAIVAHHRSSGMAVDAG
jgi:hypothetical protein